MPGLLAKMREQSLMFAEAYLHHYTAPNHYQDHLRGIILAETPSVVVETGVLHGVSSDRILEALDEIGKGTLHSIDPSPPDGIFDVDHPRWTKYRTTSVDALLRVYEHTGAWDIFLHDSDHEVWCQTFEYELAWHFVRAGGLIMSDDTTWGYPDPDHGAWDAFCDRHGVCAQMFGNMGVVRKPRTRERLPAADVVAGARELADRALTNYQRLRVGMTEIEPNLFVGPSLAAGTLGPDVPPDWCVVSAESDVGVPNGALVFPFAVSDSADNVMLDRAARAIDAQLKAGKKVLVYCAHARERSPLAVAWYLAWTGRLTMESAQRFVKGRHPSTEDRLHWLNGLRPVR